MSEVTHPVHLPARGGAGACGRWTAAGVKAAERLS
jgi:hypothetical protein